MSIPSRLVLPDGSNSVVRTDLTDLALSMGDSVPTSRRPIDLGSISNLRSSEDTAVRAREQTSVHNVSLVIYYGSGKFPIRCITPIAWAHLLYRYKSSYTEDLIQ